MLNRTPVLGSLRLLLLALAALAWAPSAPAAETPSSLAGVTVVTAEEARAMVDKGVLIVDTRVAHEYVELHIKGAVSIPYKEKSAKAVNFDARLDHFDLSNATRQGERSDGA